MITGHLPQDAPPHLERARELDPKNLDPYVTLAYVLDETGNPEEAVNLVHALGPFGMLACGTADFHSRTANTRSVTLPAASLSESPPISCG